MAKSRYQKLFEFQKIDDLVYNNEYFKILKVAEFASNVRYINFEI